MYASSHASVYNKKNDVWRKKPLTLKDRAKQLKTDIPAVFLALKRRETPWLAKLLAGLTIGYALSPIDLIPDFIPVLGWLDDLIIVPLGLILVRRLIPAALWAELHAAAEAASDRPSSRTGMAFILILWAGLLYLVYWAVRTSPWH